MGHNTQQPSARKAVQVSSSLTQFMHMNRQPLDIDRDSVEQQGQGSNDVDAAKLAVFWGWDVVGPKGLLDQVFASLQIPSRSWQGLKQACLAH